MAAQVKPKREFFVSAALLAKGYETFVPAYTSVPQSGERLRARKVALISGYVFVRGMLDRAQPPIVFTPGVVKLVRTAGQVAPINDEEIERIRIVANSPLQMQPWSYIKQGSEVNIVRGALSGVQGTVIQVKGDALLVLSIDILRRSVAVHIDRSWVGPR